jgi:formyltetrahydrofolate deformylase
MMTMKAMLSSKTTINIYTTFPRYGVFNRSRRFSSSTSHNNNNTKRLGTLRVIGQDRHGIVAACTQVLGLHNCNIIKSEQWTDPKNHMFFQRLEFHCPPVVDKMQCQNELSQKFLLLERDQQQDQTTIQATADPQDTSLPSSNFPLEAYWNWRDRKQRVGIMVSKYDHCLWELLLRHSANELDMDIDVVISNHDLLRPVVADTFGIPYHYIPITPSNKLEQEQKQLQLLKNVDCVVLARYMQILSPQFLQHFPHRILNIHHSFLPAFSGGSPYQVT